MSTRWNRFYRSQLQDEELKALVETELENLRIGAKIAKLRGKARLTQAKLAAKSGMASSKISAIENSTQNLTVGTLIKIAQATNKKLDIRFLSTA